MLGRVLLFNLNAVPNVDKTAFYVSVTFFSPQFFMKTLYSLFSLLCLHSFYFGLFGYLEKTVQQQKPTIEIYFLFLLDSEQSHTLPPLLTVSEELFRSLLVRSLKYS